MSRFSMLKELEVRAGIRQRTRREIIPGPVISEPVLAAYVNNLARTATWEPVDRAFSALWKLGRPDLMRKLWVGRSDWFDYSGNSVDYQGLAIKNSPFD